MGIWKRCTAAFRYGALCAAAGLVFGGLSASAQDRYVAQSGGSDANDGLTDQTPFATIQKAIDSLIADDSSTGYIRVAPGTYAPITSDNLYIYIEATSGPEYTFIDGGGVSPCATLADYMIADLELGYLIDYQNNTVLEGFTLQNGYRAHDENDPLGLYASSLGGGVFGGQLYNCVIRNCSTPSSGGGVVAALLFGCVVSNNVAGVNGGGAMYCEFRNSIVVDNEAYGSHHGGGAGLGCYFEDCVLENNRALNGGAAVYSTLTNCTVAVNNAHNNGGGTWESVVKQVDLIGNTAGNAGGGAYGGTLNTVSVIDNFASGDGGGLYGVYGEVVLVTGNSCGASGGGVNNSTLNNFDIKNNTAGLYGGGAAVSTLFYGSVISNEVSATGAGGGAAMCSMEYVDVAYNFGGLEGGGAIYSELARCAVQKNSSTVCGGGVQDCTTWDSWIYENSSATGGGVYGGGVYGGGIMNNIAAANGGGAAMAYLGGVFVATNKVTGVGGAGGGAFESALDTCWVESNEANIGGGIYSSHMYSGGLGFNTAITGGGAYSGSVFSVGIYLNTATNGGGIAHGTYAEDCEISGNIARVNGGGAADRSHLTFCGVHDNSAGNNGGGVYDCNMDRGYVTGNTAKNGGGMYGSGLILHKEGFWARSADAFSCVFYSNVAEIKGGAAYGSSTVNCLMAHNQAKGGAGVFDSSAHNCTIVNNSIDGRSGGVADRNTAGAENSDCVNSILWNNYYEDDLDLELSNGDQTSDNWFAFCCLQAQPWEGIGCITDNPMFTNPSAGDYTLMLGSPCINNGDNSTIWMDIDLVGNDRIQHGVVDMGCYEFGGNLIITVTLNAGPGGSVNPSELYLEFGGQFDGLTDATRYGYTFTGWTLGGVPVTASSYVTSLTPITLVAQWTPKSVAVTVNPGNGTGSTVVNLPFGSSYLTGITTPTRKGYTFNGWLDSGNNPVFTITTENAHTVHPEWTPKTINVFVDTDNDGVGDSGPFGLLYDSLYKNGLSAPTKTGYDFAGWLDMDGIPVTNVTDDMPHTVQPAWTPKMINVTVDGGATVKLPFDSDYATGLGGHIPTPPAGYEFDGWMDGDGNPVTTVNTESAHTVYPKWKGTTYIVEITDIPVIIAITADNVAQTVDITVSNCVQTTGIYYLVGVNELTGEFVPLAYPLETPVDDIAIDAARGGVWTITGIPMNAEEKFFYRAAVKLATP